MCGDLACLLMLIGTDCTRPCDNTHEARGFGKDDPCLIYLYATDEKFSVFCPSMEILSPRKGHTSVDSSCLLSGGTGIGNKPDIRKRKYLIRPGLYFLELLMYLEGGI